MYEKIRLRKGERRRDRMLPIALGISIAVLAFVIASILWARTYLGDYHAFVGRLSGSTVAAYDACDLYADSEEGTVRIAQKNIHIIYSSVANAGIGRIVEPPARDADTVLRYGDGARLEMWRVPLARASVSGRMGLCLRFTDPEGGRYTYSTERLELEDLPLSEEANLPRRMQDRNS